LLGSLQLGHCLGLNTDRCFLSLVGLPLLPTLDIDIGLYVTVVGVKAVKAVKDWLLFIKENKENKEN